MAETFGEGSRRTPAAPADRRGERASAEVPTDIEELRADLEFTSVPNWGTFCAAA
ncbi:hypothetical protein [Nocardia arthritidis]|uniref:hypothetical protein n=1 Tax=Nocardia arthritidis TaxID=228602 RepID=UPI000AF17763|nr:hypothetical protein [Nocardia arthritidis]